MDKSSLPNGTTAHTSPQPNTGETPCEISIPRHSFTAFRFIYGEATEFSHTSNVVLLGSIPQIWFRERKSGLLRTLSKATYAGIRHGVADVFENTAKFGLPDISKDPTINKLARILTRPDYDDEEDEEEEEEEEEEDDDDYDDIDNYDFAGDQVWHPDLDDDFTQENRLHLHQTSRAPKTSQSVVVSSLTDSQMDQLGRQEILHQNTEADGAAESKLTTPSFTTNGGLSQSFYSAQGTGGSSSKQNGTSTADGRAAKTSTSETLRRPGTAEDDLQSISTVSTINTNILPNKKIIFSDTSRTRQRSSQILNLKPIPDQNPTLVPLAGKSLQFEQTIKRVASRTKFRLKKDVHKMNQRRIFQKLSRAYSVGEIIKMEKMLVLVKVKSQTQANLAPFTEVEPCDTRVVERWKEYIVVARATGTVESPVLIQFFTKREIPNDMNSKHSDDVLDFSLDRGSIVNFYSALDKTIAINRNEKVYIMRCQTQTSSIRWLTFLKETLGITIPTTLKLEIPNLHLSMNIAITSQIYEMVHNKEDTDLELKLIFEKSGYRRHNPPLIEFLSQKVRSKLSEAGYEEVANAFKDEIHHLGFSWRHYDRLEWLFGETLYNLFWQQSMNDTHVLELRQIEHTPSKVEELTEPAPIEGFLARITSKSGNLKRGLFQKQVFKLSYFFTSDHLLFFSSSFKALPPLPYTDDIMDEGFLSTQGFANLRYTIPPIYDHNPFPLDENKRISWLKEGLSDEEFQKRDKYAVYELERRVGSIIRSGNVLDLTDITQVEVYDYSSLPLSIEVASSLVWNNTVIAPEHLKEHRDCYFKILMKNGTSLILRATSTEIRDEWVRRLNQLRAYWTKRTEVDIVLMNRLKSQNIERLRINDFNEKSISESTRKWENSKGVADPSLFSITPYSIYRPIIKSGFLYQKPKKHSSFKKFQVVLVPGFIILFHAFERGFTGSTHKTIYNSHYMTIPISECYVYSGSICGLDLLETEKQIDPLSPGENYVPRVYDDGCLSSDDEALRCFTLWFGTKRAISGKGSMNSGHTEFQRLSRQEAPANPGLLRMVSRLGVTGRSMVFICRSRQERDIWVSDLYTQLERFGVGNVDN